MTRPVKFLIGLLAALVMGWLWHGPAGQGEALISGVESGAREAVAQAELPGVTVRLQRDPLSRAATISGQANDLQREGMGSLFGVKDYVRDAEGVGSVRWEDEPRVGGLPLLAETLILIALAYGLGFGLGAFVFGRRRRQSFLD